MANIPFYEGDTVTLRWGETSHTCTVHRHAASCVLCGGAVVRIVPPWSGWELLCCYGIGPGGAHCCTTARAGGHRPGCVTAGTRYERSVNDL
jgi:hypothetical protein